MVRKEISGVRTSQSDASSDMDLARAPRRTARKKGSGYENEAMAAMSVLQTITKD
jgi:hypothetical protein